VNSLQPPPEARFDGDILLNEHPRALWAAGQPSPGTGDRGVALWRPQGERGTGGFRYRGKGPLHYKNRCKVLTHGVGGKRASRSLTVKWGYPSIRHLACACPPKNALRAHPTGRSEGAVLGRTGGHFGGLGPASPPSWESRGRFAGVGGGGEGPG